MYFSTSIIASALLGFAAATTNDSTGAYPYPAPASSATALAASPMSSGMDAGATAMSAGTVATHVIQVGGSNGSTVYLPNSITANPGDLVQFQFNAVNHSVVQSTFDQPCVPIQNIIKNKTDAFFSGFMPASLATGGDKLTYTIRVTDAKPIWFYCAQAKHCQKGMVGAINAPATGNKTLSAFIGLAAAAPANVIPGAPAGQGSAAQSSGAAGETAAPTGAGAGATGSVGAGASATSSDSSAPAQQTTNAAPGRISHSFAGLGLAGLAAVFML